MEDLQEFGVGIVGYGFIGKVHAYSHSALPYFYDPAPAKTKLIGVCTSSEASGQRAKAAAGFEFATTQWRDIVDDKRIQIVHCCTPNDLHEELLIAALQAGKHVYCDKPLTRTLAEAERVATAASAASGIHGMTFNCRCAPATLRAKELVEEGFLGEIYQFRGEYLHAGYIDPKRPRTWRLDFSRSGGGAIMDLGVHMLDTVRWLCGDVDSVRTALKTVTHERPHPNTGLPAPVDVDDIALVQLRLKSGAIGTVEATRMATGVQDEFRWEIHGSKGMLAFNLMDPNWLTVYDARIPEGPLGGSRGPQKIECVTRYPGPYKFGAVKNPIGWPQLHVHCLHEFIHNVATNTLGAPNFQDGLAAQRLVDACLRSATADTWAQVAC